MINATSGTTVQIPAGVTQLLALKETSRAQGCAGRSFSLSGDIIIDQKDIQRISLPATTSGLNIREGWVTLVTLNGKAGNVSIVLNIANPNSSGSIYLFYIED